MAFEKFDPPKKDWSLACVKFNGNMSAMAQSFNVSRLALQRYVARDLEAKKILDETRGYNPDHILDLAEQAIKFALISYKEKPGVALRATQQVLECGGDIRNYRLDQVKKSAPNQNEIDYNKIIAQQQFKIKTLEKKIEAEKDGINPTFNE